MTFAFVFPGQGSQSVGMMAGFDGHPDVHGTFDEASDVLGQDLWQLVTNGTDAELNQTVNTQPVMLTAGIAIWRAWSAAGGPMPSVLAGLFIYTAIIIPYAKDGKLLGYNGFMAALALSLTMVPTITRTVEVVLRLVPDGLR